MTRSEFIGTLAAANPHLIRADIIRVLDVVLNSLAGALAQGKRVELRGFGVFDAKWRGPRERRNPRTGKQVAVSGSYVLVFKPGKVLRERVNQGGAASLAKNMPAKNSPTKNSLTKK